MSTSDIPHALIVSCLRVCTWYRDDVAGDSTLSALAAHMLYYHAPILALRLPHKFDCKTFCEIVATHAHNRADPRTRTHTHTHTHCPAPADLEGRVPCYEIEVQSGRSKILALMRMPNDGEERDVTMARLRAAMAALSSRLQHGVGEGGEGGGGGGRGGGGGGAGGVRYRLGRVVWMLASPVSRCVSVE
jgi:uncharacterized membrane protein YgcG